MPSRGFFITLEGLDGCGKTTQMRLLAGRFRQEGREVVETAEPGGTPIGIQIRQILLDSANQDLGPTAELLLYFAARAQNVDQVIQPALARGAVVLSDRFTDSTLAYQGCGRGLGADAVLALDRIACRGLTPDLTLLIDTDLDSALDRARSGRPDRIEEQESAFFQKVQEAYRALAEREPGRIRVIDGRGSIGTVARRIWDVASRHV